MLSELLPAIRSRIAQPSSKHNLNSTSLDDIIFSDEEEISPQIESVIRGQLSEDSEVLFRRAIAKRMIAVAEDQIADEKKIVRRFRKIRDSLRAAQRRPLKSTNDCRSNRHRTPLAEHQANGMMLPTTTLILKNRLFIPVPTELESEFRISEGSKQFYVNFDTIP